MGAATNTSQCGPDGPAYLALLQSGELAERVRTAYARLERCDLCPRECGVNRRAGELGACRVGELAIVHSAGPHYGEERPLVGRRGSGTLFLSWCNLRCVYCQNSEISQEGRGVPVEPQELASLMLQLQGIGCHNINWVSPSHVVPQLLAATAIAAEAGLKLPIVYNTGGYDALSTLALLDGVVDIYMPDAKYADAQVGQRLSGVPDYPAVNRVAIQEMHRQVGDLIIGADGIATRGLLARHLVLPGGLAGSKDVFAFIAESIGTNTYLNVMDQYHPCYQTADYPPLDRPLRRAEFDGAVAAAEASGLHRLDHIVGRRGSS